jgi:hypothetical protein
MKYIQMQATNLIELTGLCTGICVFDKSFGWIVGFIFDDFLH